MPVTSDGTKRNYLKGPTQYTAIDFRKQKKIVYVNLYKITINCNLIKITINDLKAIYF